MAGRNRIPPMARRLVPLLRYDGWHSIYRDIFRTMREPTPEMLSLEIHIESGDGGIRYLSQEEKKEIWQAMIDEATK